MTVTTLPAFGQSPLWLQALVTAAKAAIGTSTQTNTVSFGASPIGANGAIITGITVIPNNTVTAMWCAVYYSVDAGTTLRAFAIGTCPAYTAAATLAPTPLNLTHMDGSVISPTNPIYMPTTSVVLYAGMGVAITDGAVFTINGVNL